MIGAGELHVGDYGARIGLVIRESGLVVDLSTADRFQMNLQKPDGTVLTPQTFLETTGADGRMYSLSTPSWFNQTGVWKKQATIGISGKVLNSDIVEFNVYEDLD